MPPIPYVPDRFDRLNAVVHVAHEYAILVSAAHHSLYGQAPWRSHCDDAFLLGCRKMDDFLVKKQRSLNYDKAKEVDDVLALDYLPADFPIAWELPIWSKEWRSVMNKQLAHISYKRDKQWDHTIWIPRLLPEFKTAWAKFFESIVDQDYREEFSKQLRLKQQLIALQLLP
jgi:hypothetical protein